jgi:hypothetical protein
MAEIKVRVGQQPAIKVRVGQQPAIKVISSIAGRSLSLSQLDDVNAPSLSDGMVLVYNGSTAKWDATLTLTPGATQNLDINGGNF